MSFLVAVGTPGRSIIARRSHSIPLAHGGDGRYKSSAKQVEMLRGIIEFTTKWEAQAQRI